VETEEVEFSGAGVRLSGTVTCPDTASVSPGVVLIGGSGPSDRHSGGLFDSLREHLAGAGVAALAYDKRGVGRSTGAWPAATVGELAQEGAAADLVRQLTAAVRAGHGYQEGQRIIDAYQDEPWYAVLRASGFTLEGTVWSQLSAWGDHDPHDDLVRLKIPTLAIFGRSDPLVPIQASIAAYDETAARTARPQQTVVFPDADHQLRIAAGFAPGYLTCLSDWCREQEAGRLVDRDGSGQ
jgi:pimeloyl-ACP methyl ester carboxylesterase